MEVETARIEPKSDNPRDQLAELEAVLGAALLLVEVWYSLNKYWKLFE